MGKDKLYRRLSLSRLEGGELSIKGVVFSAYCSPFLLLMSALLLLPGLLLTAVSWRPDLMQYYDLGEEWTTRLQEISRVRVAGPVLIVREHRFISQSLATGEGRGGEERSSV